MLNQLQTKEQKFVSIDTMRGIAVLMVMLVHTSQQVSGLTFLKSFSAYGQMGVQLFFVASAFTLCHSLDIRRINESLLNFYIRRYFRIAPAYYVGILIYFAINIFYSYINKPSVWINDRNPFHILINVLFLNGLYSPANNRVVPGGWSIGTEMLFYLIFPILFIIYKHLQLKFKYFFLFAPIYALFLSISVQFSIYILTMNASDFGNNSFYYFSILNQLPVFCIGISTYFAYKNDFLKNFKISTNLLCFILLSFLSGYLMIKGLALFMFINAVTPFISAFSFVFLFNFLQFSRQIRSKLLAKIGVVSYSCYLLHILFAYFLTNFLSHRLSFIYPDISLILFYLITISLTYFLAKLMYKYVEFRGIELGKNLIQSINKRNHVNAISHSHQIKS